MKPKIIIDRDPVSSEEILSRRNFRQLVTDAKLIQKPFFKSTWFISSLAVTMSAVALLVYLNPGSEPDQQNSTAITGNPAGNTSQLQYAEDSPCIKPPLRGAEKPFTSVMIDPGKDALIKHNSGTALIIPAGSVTDLNGNIVKGEIEIRFRELHTLPEIMLSGIPMEYDSAGTKYAFTSAGMIQVYGYQNGQPVQLKEGAQIKIVLASSRTGSEFNLYDLDTTSGNWTFIGKDQVGQKKDKMISMLPQPVLQVENESKSSYDKSIRKTEKELAAIGKEIQELNASQPARPKQVDPEKYNFDIEADPSEFPELAALPPVRYEVGPENRNFTAENYDITWENVLLLENEKGKNYKIRLIKGKLVREYIVYPVYEGKSYQEAMEKFTRDFDAYNSELRKKGEKEMEKKKELEILNQKRNEEIRAKNAELRVQQEREMKREEEIHNNEYYLRQYGLSAKNGIVYNVNSELLTSNSSIVTRTFDLDGFGTYNSDHPRAFPNPVKGQLAFYDKSTRLKSDPQELFLIVKDDNLYIRYFRNNFGSFGFHPKKSSYLVAIMADGQVGIAGPDQFNTPGNRNEIFKIELEMSEAPVRNEEQFRALIGNF